MDFVTIFIFFIIIIIIFIYYENKFTYLTYVKSNIDKEEYLVRKLEDNKDAANILAKLNKKVKILLHHLKTNFNDDIRTQRLLQRYKPHALQEGIPSLGQTSYSINKGELISMCIREKTSNKLVPINTVTFVLIHELAHIATTEIGHTPLFWNNMRWLLKESVKIGIYDYIDYNNDPQPYCGIQVSDTPLSKEEIKNTSSTPTLDFTHRALKKLDEKK